MASLGLHVATDEPITVRYVPTIPLVGAADYPAHMVMRFSEGSGTAWLTPDEARDLVSELSAALAEHDAATTSPAGSVQVGVS
ncbi:hypothetical protein [Nocardia flavorosea]|uniref:hypothetical protein n=1 Tax=Nocardia flavorosea TaxID=53429 RepID=UPI002456B2D8|nr:hypothetical protein [Nocardia flavorosea]